MTFVFRHLLKYIQVRRAIAGILPDPSVRVTRIRSCVVFRDCGSKTAAFISALSDSDYDVTCRTTGGTETILWITARFHPIWCSLRDIRIMGGSNHSKPNAVPSQPSGPIPLSDRVEKAIEVMFIPDEWEVAGRIIAGIRNLPLAPADAERIRLAVLKTSGSTIGGLKAASEMASTDWRDVLAGAGFHSPETHLEWQPCFVPQPIPIQPHGGNAIAYLEGIPIPQPATEGFPSVPDGWDVRQLRLCGCPPTKGRYFTGRHSLSGCGGYLGLEELDPHTSTSDAPFVRLVIVQPASRLQSIARSWIPGRISPMGFTTTTLRYDHQSDPSSMVVHDECHLEALEWTALLA